MKTAVGSRTENTDDDATAAAGSI